MVDAPQFFEDNASYTFDREERRVGGARGSHEAIFENIYLFFVVLAKKEKKNKRILYIDVRIQTFLSVSFFG